MSAESVCRTCLGTVGLRPLFPRTLELHTVRDALRLCTGLAIEKDDDMPQTICKHCTSAIQSAMRFRHRCQATEKRLIEQRQNKIYRRIFFNNNDDLKALTKIKGEKYKLFNDKEDFCETKVKIETQDEQSDNNDVLLIHFPNNVFEVTEVDTIDNLLDSLLCELNKDKVENEETDVKINLHETNSLDDSLSYVDLPNFDANEYLNLEITKAPKEEKTKIEDKSIAKESKPKLTRLDLIDGPPNKFGPNQCKLCKNISPNIKSFYKHLNNKHFGNQKAILCEFCAMRFTDNQKLLRHCRAKHGLERDDSFPCSHCSYRALDKEQLDVHERRVHTKERPFVCDNCGAGFFSKRVLVQHSRNHTDAKPYQCDRCPSKFKTRQRLCGHSIKTHRRRYAYACPLCDKRLSKSPYVRRHLLREHGVPLDRQGELRKVYLQ